MPESKHRRHGRNRPRAYETATPARNPQPSPEWVPIVGTGLLIAGLLVILVGYLPAVSVLMRGWPILGANWSLVGGFVLLITGFGFLMRWR